MIDKDICYYCRINAIKVDGMCEECYAEHQATWNKMDEWLMDNT